MSEDLGKWILMAMALLFAVLAWRAWQVRQASTQWPWVQGEILEARVRAHNETGDQRGTPTHAWFTEVSYRYTVDGRTYTGNRLRAFGRQHFDRAQAEQEIQPFAPGTRVKVYYDPARPGSSVLLPG